MPKGKRIHIGEKQIWPVQLITEPGIYHNSEMGLISFSSDGTNWITLADKNVGATGTSGNDAMGNFFQAGNNFAFPRTGIYSKTSSTRVDASSYSAGGYTDDTFILVNESPRGRQSSNNKDLRGGVTGTNEARQGPCQDGFHVPSKAELDNFVSTATTLLGTLTRAKVEQGFFFVSGAYRTRTTSNISSGYNFLTFGSDFSSGQSVNCLRLEQGGTKIISTTTYPSNAFQVRPFKNTPLQPWVSDSWEKIEVNVQDTTTVVCDFRSGAAGQTTTYAQLVNTGDFVWQTNGTQASQVNGRLRCTITQTDQHGHLVLGGGVNPMGVGRRDKPLTCKGYAYITNPGTANNRLRQHLIKKAYAKIYTVTWGQSFTFPGVSVSFSKKVTDTNLYYGFNRNQELGAIAGFIFKKAPASGYSSYQTGNTDSSTRFLALPSHPNTGFGVTSTSYIDQGQDCLYSRVTLETRGDHPDNFHYRLIVDKTGNEYDLGLCKNLGSANLGVNCGDWRQQGNYKEISEAYLEMYDDWYIDENGNITQTKPW